MHNTIPPQVKQYFWGDNLSELNWQDHRDYITQVLLEKGDVSSLNWLFQHVSRTDLLKTLPNLRLDPKSKNFWSIYLS